MSDCIVALLPLLISVPSCGLHRSALRRANLPAFKPKNTILVLSSRDFCKIQYSPTGGERFIMDIFRWILIFAGVVASQACSPVPGWQPKSVPQLVAAAPIVAKVKIVSTTGNINRQTAVAEVACSVKNEVGTPLGKTIVVTGFGSESLCKVPARTGEERLVFLQVENSGSTPPTFRLVYTDMFAGTKPATPANVAAAKSAVRPGAVKTRDITC